MAYTRPCNKCGQRISLREMPHGQWVAFDVSTEESHVCGVEHEPDVAVKLKGKNKSRTKEDEDDESREVIITRLAATWAAAGMILMPVPDGEIAPAFISKSYRRKLLKREKLMEQFIKC